MAQQLINVLGLASVYCLFGVGFNLVLGALNILNVAHAALFSVGAFGVYWLMSLAGLPPGFRSEAQHLIGCGYSDHIETGCASLIAH